MLPPPNNAGGVTPEFMAGVAKIQEPRWKKPRELERKVDDLFSAGMKTV